jgi:hypothetical protein
VTGLLLALQLAACPPSLTCTLPALQTTPPVTVSANPNRPAQWFTAAMVLQLATFETYAATHDAHTVSQWTQEASRDHHAVRYVGISLMALLTWHLFVGGPF